MQLDPELLTEAAQSLNLVAKALQRQGRQDDADRLTGQAADLELMSPELQACWGGPFNGQAGRQAIAGDILAALRPRMLIETGSYRGVTTEWLARATAVPLFSCETEKLYFLQATRRLASFRQVSLSLEDSRQMLSRLLTDDNAGLPLFIYLDAHWEQDLPLREELEIVFARCRNAVVMIDDFRVPDDPGYGFDDYGPGRALDLAQLDGVLPADCRIYFPALSSAAESGARRGCCVLSQASSAPLLDRLPVLRGNDLAGWRSVEAEAPRAAATPGEIAATETLTDLSYPDVIRSLRRQALALREEIQRINADRQLRLDDSVTLTAALDVARSALAASEKDRAARLAVITRLVSEADVLRADIAAAGADRDDQADRARKLDAEVRRLQAALAVAQGRPSGQEKRTLPTSGATSGPATGRAAIRSFAVRTAIDAGEEEALAATKAQALEACAPSMSAETDQKVGPGEERVRVFVDALALAYQRILGRLPDADGLIAWTRAFVSGVDPVSLLLDLATGAEATARGFDLAGVVGDAEPAFIDFVYRLCVGRNSLEAEREKWLQDVATGVPAFDILGALSATGALPQPAGPQTPAGRSPSETEDSLASAVRLVYRLLLKRAPSDHDVRMWSAALRAELSFADFLGQIDGSEEAKLLRGQTVVAPTLGDGDFAFAVVALLLQRGLIPTEVVQLQAHLDEDLSKRADYVTGFLNASVLNRSADPAAAPDPAAPMVASLMGTGRTLSQTQWDAKEKTLGRRMKPAPVRALGDREPFTHSGAYDVTAIASLYRGGRYLERFLDSITSQTLFDRSELIFIDAASPEGEERLIRAYQARYPNIVYHRVNYRIGIYEAWNVGVQMARGKYLTNTNLDDLRREDSFALQAAALDRYDEIDVVYQDFLYTFNPDLSFGQIEELGFKSELPVLTGHNLLQYNSPHNAPMWRKSLHDDLGPFDVSFRSAGDYEFWVRCLAAGKRFWKINTPHVAYYVNPKGISTRPDTPGIVEHHRILKSYAPRLTAPELLESRPDFANRVGGERPVESRIAFSRYDVTQRALLALAGAAR